MKKSELKTEIRNRILEKKKSIDEVDNFTKTRDSEFNQDLEIIAKSGFEQKRAAIINALQDFLEKFNITGRTIKPYILSALDDFDKQMQAEPEEEEAEEKEDDVNEMSTSAGAGSYLTKYAFKLPKDYKKAKEVNEAMDKTTKLAIEDEIAQWRNGNLSKEQLKKSLMDLSDGEFQLDSIKGFNEAKEVNEGIIEPKSKKKA